MLIEPTETESLEQLDALLQATEGQEYLDGEIICREGERGDSLYLLIDGTVDIVKGHGTPEELRLARLEAVNYFGEMAILDDRPRSATVVVTAEARLLTLSGESFQDLMLQMPEISFEICRSLSSRVRGLEAEHRRTEPPMHEQ